MTNYQKSLAKHAEWAGKLEQKIRAECQTAEDLSLAYTPGVAAPCLEIARDPSLSFAYTRRHNTVAVISDGSAVLGLGNIGSLAAMPVMEGKALLFKRFADIDAIPIVMDTQDVDQIVATVRAIAPSFGGINLEDISAPRCFEVEARLTQALDIPVFHDDQHGTAIVVAAAIQNCARLTRRDPKSYSVTIVGAGAAGSAVARLLLAFGIKDIILCDQHGTLHTARTDLSSDAMLLASQTNPTGLVDDLADAVRHRDILIGVSVGGIVTPQMIASMNPDPLVFALANPTPEIMPDLALEVGAYIVASGRSDFPNQINNVLAFPGVFRGALDNKVKAITTQIKLAAAHALANVLTDSQLSRTQILPSPFDPAVVTAIARSIR